MSAPGSTVMTARSPLVAVVATCAAATLACSVSYFEIPIETPIQPKLDVSGFQRVLVAGFVSGGSDDVDANQETVPLLRSQLRSRSALRVIDTDVMPLLEIAREQPRAASGGDPSAPPATASAADGGGQPLPLPEDIEYVPAEGLIGSVAASHYAVMGSTDPNTPIANGPHFV